MSERLNRRTFIQGSAATAGILPVLGAGAAPLVAGSATSTGAPIRVKKLYLAKPVPTWPTPHLNVEEERQKLEGTLAGLAREMRDVVFEGGELLRVIDDVPKVRGSLAEVDGILIFNLTSGVGNMIRALAESGKPTLLFSQPYSGHDWSMIADLQDAGLRIDVIASSNYRDLLPGIRPFRTIRRLAESKILVLRKTGTDEAAVSERLGVKIVPLQHQRIIDAYEKADLKEAETEAKRWIDNAAKIVEPSRDEIVRSARFYLAMKRVMAEEAAQAITINCLGLFYAGQLPAYPCLGFSRLNSSGQVGACEGDVESTLTMLVFQYMGGKPGFITDPVIDTGKGTVIHAHCVAPVSMEGVGGREEPYVLRSHMEDDKGAVVQVKMRVGQTITMAKLVGSDMMLLSTGEIIDTPVSERGCRTQITTRVKDPRKLLEQYRHGLHRVIFYGDHTGDVERLSKFLKFKVVYEV
ncbi:MAG: hypothetical protein EHM61_26780 [Acidobacteria bacterium]|nr:MAG: hypothetical protein EHM61_26780 [Acidobacteriota bacterium]